MFKVHSYKFKKNQFLKEISFEVFKSVKNQYNKFIDIWKQAGDFIGGYYFGKDVEREDIQKDLVLEANTIYKKTKHGIINP